MKKVVDFQILKGGTTEMIRFGRVILEDGVITYDGLSEQFIAELNDFGVIGDPKDGPIFPKDGERFLEALQRDFTGSALRASDVREIG